MKINLEMKNLDNEINDAYQGGNKELASDKHEELLVLVQDSGQCLCGNKYNQLYDRGYDSGIECDNCR